MPRAMLQQALCTVYACTSPADPRGSRGAIPNVIRLLSSPPCTTLSVLPPLAHLPDAPNRFTPSRLLPREMLPQQVEMCRAARIETRASACATRSPSASASASRIHLLGASRSCLASFLQVCPLRLSSSSAGTHNEEAPLKPFCQGRRAPVLLCRIKESASTLLHSIAPSLVKRTGTPAGISAEEPGSSGLTSSYFCTLPSSLQYTVSSFNALMTAFFASLNAPM